MPPSASSTTRPGSNTSSDRRAPSPNAGSVAMPVVPGVHSCDCGDVAEVVVVSGAPGAGKSTLAAPLARALGFPLLAKDVIKESLFDSLGQLDADPLASSWRLGGAAMELLWRPAEECPSVVIEANFRSHSVYERQRCGHCLLVRSRCTADFPSSRRPSGMHTAAPGRTTTRSTSPGRCLCPPSTSSRNRWGSAPCWRSTPRRRSTCQRWPSRS